MKKTTLIILLLTVFVLVMGVTVVAADDANQSTKSNEALRSPMSGGSSLVPGLLTTDFEAGDGFAPGSCNGQNNWTYFGATPASQEISTANPAGGTQHLRLNEDPGLGTSNYVGCYVAGGSNGVDISFDVDVSDTGGADYIVAVFSAIGDNSGQMTFDWQGDINVADGSGITVDTGVDWIIGGYHTARIERTATNVNYYYDGNLIASPSIFGGDIVEVDFASDNWQNGDTGDFDNLRVEDPTAVGLNDLSGSTATTLLPVAVAALLGLLSVAVWVGSKRDNQQII